MKVKKCHTVFLYEIKTLSTAIACFSVTMIGFMSISLIKPLKSKAKKDNFDAVSQSLLTESSFEPLNPLSNLKD